MVKQAKGFCDLQEQNKNKNQLRSFGFFLLGVIKLARLYHLGETPIRPGTYFRTSSGDVTTVGAVNGIVAAVYRANWGPLNKVVNISVEDMNNLTDIVGTGNGYRVVHEAFLGGATMVRAVRAGEGGTVSRLTWRNDPKTTTTTDPTTGARTTTTIPAVYVIEFRAKYVGARVFTTTVRQNPLLDGTKQILFYDENNRLIETLSFKSGGNESKKANEAVNSNSKYFTAKVLVDNEKLAIATQRKFTAGTDPEITLANFEAAMGQLERYYWNVIVTDSHSNNVVAMLRAFIQQSYEMGHLGIAVVGTTFNYTFEDRLATAAALNDWRMVYLLNGWYDFKGVVHYGWDAAARIGGMIAACETNASLTHIVIQDAVELTENFTNGQIIQAEEKGCMVFSLNDEDQVWIDNSITTLVTLGNDQDEGWKKIRRTKCRFELMTRINRTCDKLIGRLNNDANGRATLVTAMQSVINEMIAEGKLFSGSNAGEDPRYKPVGDRAYFYLQIGDIDSMEKIYLDYNFSYANPFEETASA